MSNPTAQNHNTIMGERIMSQTNQSWQSHGQYSGLGHSQDLWDASEYHNWVVTSTQKKIIHMRQIDTTDPAIVNLAISSMSKCAGESFATSASAKTKASSLQRTDSEINQRQECRHGQSRSASTRIQSNKLWATGRGWNVKLSSSGRPVATEDL